MSKSALTIVVAALVGVLSMAAAAHAGPCPADGAQVADARSALHSACGCDDPAVGHAAYLKCARPAIDHLIENGQLPKACRNELRHYVTRSTCGTSSVACCMKSGLAAKWRAAVRKDAAGCKAPRNGAACVSAWPFLAESCSPTGGCQNGPCGNGTIDPGEQCDPPGTATCDAQCHFVTTCGDGQITWQTNEQCEPPGTATCDAHCQFIHTCGNGVIEPGEECDGGGACNGECQLTRRLCCELGNLCIEASATDALDEYEFSRTCSLILPSTVQFGLCQGTPGCPPEIPPSLGCKVGSCGDQPIEPLQLCCQHPNGTCTETLATTAGAVGAFGCTTSFPPPDVGDVKHLMLGTCGVGGRCVPLQ